MSRQRREFSKAVKLSAWKRSNGHCEGCTAKLFPGKYEFHHDKEDTFGGEPTLDNCKVLCIACHGGITRKRAADIAKSNRVRDRHLGIATKSNRRLGDPLLKKKMDGSVVRR